MYCDVIESEVFAILATNDWTTRSLLALNVCILPTKKIEKGVRNQGSRLSSLPISDRKKDIILSRYYSEKEESNGREASIDKVMQCDIFT